MLQNKVVVGGLTVGILALGMISQAAAADLTRAWEVLDLADYTGGKFPMQIGYGANGKNLEVGFSTWFKYDGDQTSTRHADINVSLIEKTLPESEPVPEPAMGLLSLGVIGFLKQGRKASQKCVRSVLVSKRGNNRRAA